jgi:elongation factor G
VAFIAIEPYTRTAGDKIEDALKKLSREDPSIRWSKDEKTDQLILSGMGLLHLEIAQDRLLTHYKIDRESAMWGEIEVEYSECLLAHAGPHRAVYDRAIRDKAGKAACTATLSPLDDAHDDDLSASTIERDGNTILVSFPNPANTDLPFDPSQVHQLLLNGAIAALARGPRRSCPVRRCHVHLSFDPAEDFFGPASSTPGHITNAALHAVRTALRDAYAAGQVGVLEPFARVRIACPEEVGHAIQHDLSSARGGVVLEVRKPEDEDAGGAGNGEEGVEVSKVYVPADPYESAQSLRGPKKSVVRMLTIVGKAPLKEMMKYDGQLRGLTGGRHALQLDQGGFELVTGSREKALEGR